MPRAQLSKWRLFGLDRSGPPPSQTATNAPWRPWTIPNAIGYVRAALIPAFLVLEYGSRHGVSTAAGICFFIASAGDYLDGVTARLTGQTLGAVLTAPQRFKNQTVCCIVSGGNVDPSTYAKLLVEPPQPARTP